MAERLAHVSERDSLTWSVMIPAYNAAGTLAETLDSVLSADVGPASMEIVVVDDASTDDTEQVARAFDPRVGYHRRETNGGAIANFNTCVSLASGSLVHLLHADDRVLPGFYGAMEAAFDSPSVGAAFCRTRFVDGGGAQLKVTRSEREGSGPLADPLGLLTTSNRVATPAIAVRSAVYDELGAFDERLPHAADWDMWVRISAHHDVWFEDAVLAEYRIHEEQHTASQVLTGQNMRERRACIESFARYHDALSWPAARRRAMAYSALFALRTAGDLARARKPGGTAIQLGEALSSLRAAAQRPDPLDAASAWRD